MDTILSATLFLKQDFSQKKLAKTQRLSLLRFSIKNKQQNIQRYRANNLCKILEKKWSFKLVL